MAGGSCRIRKRTQRAPIGFCPLQRSELWKSTNPGFPSPGLFPSRRFSHPQGFAPSRAARACSIPQPLLGFRLQDPPVGGDAPEGDAPRSVRPTEGYHDPKDEAAISATRRLDTPKGTRLSRGMDEPLGEPVSSLGALWRAVKPTSGTRPSWRREPLPNLLLSSRVRQAGRPVLHLTAPTRRRAPIGPGRAAEDPRNPEGSWFFGGSEPRPKLCRQRGGSGSEHPFGRSKLRPPFGSGPCDLRWTQGPRPATSHVRRARDPSSWLGLTLGRPHARGGASSFRCGRRPVRRSRAQGPSAPEAGPGRRRPSARSARCEALGSPRRTQASVSSSFGPSIPSGPRPFRSGDQATHGRFGIRLHDPTQASDSRLREQAPSALRSQPTRRCQAEARRCRNADPAGQSRCPRSRATSRAGDGRGKPLLPVAQAVRAWAPRGCPPPEALCRVARLRRRAGAAGASSHCRWHRSSGLGNHKGCRTRRRSAGGLVQRPLPWRPEQAPAAAGEGRPGLATTRAAALGSTLPVERCTGHVPVAEKASLPCRGRRSKLLRPVAQAVRAWQPRGLPRSEHLAGWPGATATRVELRRQASATLCTGRPGLATRG
jgi:hypothetical protein